MQNRGKFSSNALASGANFAVSLLIGVFFTPYLLHSLGQELYGLVPLTNTIVSYLGVATAGLHIAVSRFVAISLEKGDLVSANRIFNTSLVTLWGVCGILLIPLTLLALYGDHLIQVPSEHAHDLRVLFAFCGLTFIISTSSSAFGVSLFFKNRFDLQSAIALSSNLLRVLTIILCFYFFRPYLWHVGIAMVLSASLSAILNILSWKKLTPELQLHPKLWSQKEFKNIASSSGWILISQVGTILLISIDLFVVNRMLGPLANTQYALALQWSILLRGIAGTLGGLFAPDMTAFYAKGEIEELVVYSKKVIRWMGMFLALPVGLIIGFSSSLLTVWVGEEFSDLASLMTLLTFPLAVNLAYMPLHNISIAANKVRLPGIIQVMAGVINLILAVSLVKFTPLGMYGVALAGALVLTIKNLIFTPLYAAHVLKLPLTTFVGGVIPCLFAVLMVAGLGWIMSNWVTFENWLALGAGASVVGLFYIILAYIFLLNSGEKKDVIVKLRKVLKLPNK